MAVTEAAKEGKRKIGAQAQQEFEQATAADDEAELARFASMGPFKTEATRRLRALQRRNKPGLAATILTAAQGVDDDDNIRRPTLLGA